MMNELFEAAFGESWKDSVKNCIESLQKRGDELEKRVKALEGKSNEQ